MKLWRIAADTHSHAAANLGEFDAALHPGRWSKHQKPVVYGSPSIAIAGLETLAQINDTDLPMNRILVGIEVPAEI